MNTKAFQLKKSIAYAIFAIVLGTTACKKDDDDSASSSDSGSSYQRKATTTFTQITNSENPFGSASTISGLGSISLVDYDNDGDDDVVMVGGASRQIYYFENNGNSSFTEHAPTSSSNPFGSGSYANASQGAVGLSDVDGDGDVDIVASSDYGSSGHLQYFRNDGTSGFTNFTSFNSSNPFNGSFANDDYTNQSSVLFIDADGDGDDDIVAQDQNGNTAYWEKGTSTSTPYTTSSSNPFSSISNFTVPSTYAIADVDLDGELDVLVGSYSQGIVYFTKGTNTSYSVVNNSASNNPFSSATGTSTAEKVLLADFDRDGYLDLLVGDNSGSLRYYKGS